MSSARLHHVDTLRGLACLMLVTYHVIGGTPAHGLHLSQGLWREATDLLAAVRMPLFAFIAGAMHGLVRSVADWSGAAHLLRGKVRRLLLPMLTVGTLFALVRAGVDRVMPGINDGEVNWALLHLVPVAHYWFLASLMGVFVLVALLERAGLLASPLRWALVMAAAVALSVSGAADHLPMGGTLFGLWGTVYLLPHALLGLAVTRLGALRAATTRATTRAATPLALGLTVTLAAAGLLSGPHALRTGSAMLLAGAGAALGLWLLAPRQALLARVGRASFAIFLFHVFFTAATRIALDSLGQALHAPVPTGLHLAAGLLAGVAGPMVLLPLINRHRLARLLVLGERELARPHPATPGTTPAGTAGARSAA